MQRLRRQDTPPEGGPRNFVRRLKGRERSMFTILSPHFHGCFVHWTGSRTIPCEADDDSCHGHRHKMPCKWKGYLWCINHNARQQEFLEFTRVGALDLLRLYDKGMSLRGQRIQVARGNGDKTGVKIEPCTPFAAVEQLPKDLEPYDTLEQLWEMAGRPRVQTYLESEIEKVA